MSKARRPLLEQTLLKSHANDVLMTIQAAGLDPSDFEWSRRKSTSGNSTVSVLLYHPTGAYYVFDLKDNCAECSPGMDTTIERFTAGSWSLQLSYVDTWLRSVKREAKEPDLWAAILQEKILVLAATSPKGRDAPFSAKERRYVSSQLKNLKRHLSTTQNLSNSQMRFITARLNYLEEAAQRQGRRDWIHTAIGVLFTIAVGVALAPDSARELFRLAGTLFQRLLGGSFALP